MKHAIFGFLFVLLAPFSVQGNLFFTVDFIYWKASQEQLVYAVSGVNGNGLPSFSRGEYLQPDFSWNPGFKIGAGYTFCDCWDVYLQYTRYTSTKNPNSASAPSSTESTLIAGNSVEATPLTNMDGNWKLYFNTLDLELGRTFCPWQCIHFRPYIGLKASWQEQDFKVQLTRTGAADPDEDVFIVQTQDQENWGLGIRGGVYSSWFVPCSNWSLYSNIALATIWTDFKNHRVDTITSLTTPGTIDGVNADYDFCSADAVIEMQLGLRWSCLPAFWCTRISLQAGYEMQVWINHGQMLNLPSEGGVYNGDLNLHGLTARLHLDF